MNRDEMNRQNIKSIIKDRLKNISRNNIKQRFKIFVHFLNHNAAQVKRCHVIQRRVSFLNERSFKKNESDFRNRIMICHRRQFKRRLKKNFIRSLNVFQ